jgi:hypothetical protein
MVAPWRSNRIESPPSNCVSGVVAIINKHDWANVAAVVWFPASNAAIAASVLVCRSAKVAMVPRVYGVALGCPSFGPASNVGTNQMGQCLPGDPLQRYSGFRPNTRGCTG